jgi:hypothetical protein
MKTSFWTVATAVSAIVMTVSMCLGFRAMGHANYIAGWNAAKAEIPSCIYVRRAKAAYRPFGCDGQEGVDVESDDIVGGGLYVSLAKWTKAKVTR